MIFRGFLFYRNGVAIMDITDYKARLRDFPDVMDVPQLSVLLGVSKKTIYSLLKNGELTSVKIGRSYKVPKTHVLKYLKLVNE